MSKKTNRVKNIKQDAYFNKITLYLMIFAMSVIPLLVRVVSINYPMNQFDWYVNQTQFFDVFSKIKSDAILIAGLVALILIIISFRAKVEKRNILTLENKIVVSYAGLIVLSTIFSVSTYVSIHGYLERYESIFVLLSYLMIFMLGASFLWTDKRLSKLMLSFVVSNIILSIIGLFQYMGIDLIFNKTMQGLITSSALKGFEFDLNKSFDYTAIFQTLYHSNYVGQYISLSLPIILTLFLYEKRKSIKVLYLITSILMLFNLIGSISRGGIIGVSTGLLIFAVLNYKILFKNKKVILALFLIISMTAIGFEVYTNGFMTSRFKQIFSSTTPTYTLTGIEVNENQIVLNYHDDELKIDIESRIGTNWRLKYELNNQSISPTGINESGHAYFDGDLTGIEIFLYPHDNIVDLVILVDKTPWLFGYENDELKYKNIYGNYTQIEVPKTIGFSGMEKLGSGRGYIWSRTLPKILERPLLGFGPDTFALAFPQNDYVGKYRAYGTTNMLVDKPHNLYLQIAISTGIPSLVLFLWLAGLNFQGVYKIFRRRNQILDYNQDYKQILLYGFTVSIFSYLIASSFADSNVNVSIVFWVMMGLSFSLQNQLKNSEEKDYVK